MPTKLFTRPCLCHLLPRLGEFRFYCPAVAGARRSLNQTVELSLSLLSATRQQQQHYSYEKRGVELWSHTHTHRCCLSPRLDKGRNGGLLARDHTSLVRLCREPTKVTKVKLSWTDLVMNYLVDPASSHMLVSKIKPCMSKYN